MGELHAWGNADAEAYVDKLIAAASASKPHPNFPKDPLDLDYLLVVLSVRLLLSTSQPPLALPALAGRWVRSGVSLSEHMFSIG